MNCCDFWGSEILPSNKHVFPVMVKQSTPPNRSSRFLEDVRQLKKKLGLLTAIPPVRAVCERNVVRLRQWRSVTPSLHKNQLHVLGKSTKSVPSSLLFRSTLLGAVSMYFQVMKSRKHRPWHHGPRHSACQSKLKAHIPVAQRMELNWTFAHLQSPETASIRGCKSSWATERNIGPTKRLTVQEGKNGRGSERHSPFTWGSYRFQHSDIFVALSYRVLWTHLQSSAMQ